MDTVLTTLGVVGIVLLAVLAVAAVVLVVGMVRKYKEVHHPDAPVSAKVAFWVSLVYTVFPIDALPDPIFLDDIVVLITGLIYVRVQLRQRKRVAGDSAAGVRPRSDHP